MYSGANDTLHRVIDCVTVRSQFLPSFLPKSSCSSDSVDDVAQHAALGRRVRLRGRGRRRHGDADSRALYLCLCLCRRGRGRMAHLAPAVVLVVVQVHVRARSRFRVHVTTKGSEHRRDLAWGAGGRVPVRVDDGEERGVARRPGRRGFDGAGERGGRGDFGCSLLHVHSSGGGRTRARGRGGEEGAADRVRERGGRRAAGRAQAAGEELRERAVGGARARGRRGLRAPDGACGVHGREQAVGRGRGRRARDGARGGAGAPARGRGLRGRWGERDEDPEELAVRRRLCGVGALRDPGRRLGRARVGGRQAPRGVVIPSLIVIQSAGVRELCVCGGRERRVRGAVLHAVLHAVHARRGMGILIQNGASLREPEVRVRRAADAVDCLQQFVRHSVRRRHRAALVLHQRAWVRHRAGTLICSKACRRVR
ncbi:hypothetical protein B0H17DRAFT_202093 [Mycena rosella]|uniref:Uncharacterized protein n=1 Tax=Mycena rosella TaxID=1033263 RepID=A0AAD7CYK8_MYCRO|nr:hypothetical protein B0H17DRAFT_202093 [Mycena rosella]